MIRGAFCLAPTQNRCPRPTHLPHRDAKLLSTCSFFDARASERRAVKRSAMRQDPTRSVRKIRSEIGKAMHPFSPSGRLGEVDDSNVGRRLEAKEVRRRIEVH